MNNVVIIGRLTKEPDIRYTSDQLAVATFTVAIDRGKDKNGNDRGTDYPRVIVFGRQAENCERFLIKGIRVAIQGHIQTGSYDKDGRKVYTTDVIADRVEFIEYKDKNSPQRAEEPAYNDVPEGFRAISEEDIPF